MTREEFEQFLDDGARSQVQVAVDDYADAHYPEVVKLIPLEDGTFILVKSRITSCSIGFNKVG